MLQSTHSLLSDLGIVWVSRIGSLKEIFLPSSKTRRLTAFLIFDFFFYLTHTFKFSAYPSFYVITS